MIAKLLQAALVKRLIYVTGAIVFLRLSTAFTTILLTHWLPIEEYGHFSYGQSIALLVMFGASIGLPTLIVKELAAPSSNGPALMRLCLLLLAALTLVHGLLLTGGFISKLLPRDLMNTVLPMALGGAGFAGNMVLQSFFRARDRFGLQSGLLVFQAVLMATTLLSAAYLGATAQTLAWAFTATVAICFLLHCYCAFRLIGWPERGAGDLFGIFRRTLPFGMIEWIMAGFPLVIGTGLIMVAGAADVAIFYAGLAVFSATFTIATIVDQVFLREILRADDGHRHKAVALYILAALTVGFIIAALLYSGADLLASLFFQTTKENLVAVLELLAFAVLFRFVAMACSSPDRLSGRQKQVLFQYVLGIGTLAAITPFVIHDGVIAATTAFVGVEGGLALLFLLRRTDLIRTPSLVEVPKHPDV